MAQTTCVISGCDDAPTPSGRGHCPHHFWLGLRDGTILRTRGLPPLLCLMAGCGEQGWSRDWCRYHYERWVRTGNPATFIPRTPQERFWARVDKHPDGGCWMWTGGATDGNYGVCHGLGAAAGGETYAYRIAYTWLVGPIPAGLQLDHLCHSRDKSCQRRKECPHRRCVRPDHLEPVTGKINSDRVHGSSVTHCGRGHPYDGPARKDGGWRRCRTCQNESSARHKARKRAQALQRKLNAGTL